MALPVHVVALGPVQAPVGAAGLSAPSRALDHDRGYQVEVGRLPAIHARLRQLAIAQPRLGCPGAELVQLGSGPSQALGAAQHPGAGGHDALDLVARRRWGQHAERVARAKRLAKHGAAPARVGRGSWNRRPGHRGPTFRDVGGDALGEDQPLKEGVGGQPVGSVDPGTGDLPAGVQAVHPGAATQVGTHAAAGVVRGRGDRDRLGDRVDTVFPAGGQDRRETGHPHLGAECPAVQVHVLRAGVAHALENALGDDVPGGQLGQLVAAHHEPDPVPIHQVGPLAPDRLGNQWLLSLSVPAQVEHGRVKLHELQIAHFRPGAQRQRHSVAGGHGGVGGGGEHLAHAPGGQDHIRGVHGTDAVPPPLAHHVQGDPGCPPVGVD